MKAYAALFGVVFFAVYGVLELLPKPAAARASTYVQETVREYAVAQYAQFCPIGPGGGTVRGAIYAPTFVATNTTGPGFISRAGANQYWGGLTTVGSRFCFNYNESTGACTGPAFMSFGAGSILTFSGMELTATRYVASGSSGGGGFAMATGVRFYMDSAGVGTKWLEYNSTSGTFLFSGANLNIGSYAATKQIAPVTSVIDFASIAVANCADSSGITVTGAADGNVVKLGVPNAAMVTGSQFTAWASATDTVTVRHCCVGNATCDPGSGTFTVVVEK